MTSIYFEDMTPGRVIPLAPYPVSAEEIIEFARQFDPAPFHLDEEAGRQSFLGGLAASGWHVCSMSMRMMCDAYMLEASGQGSPGIERCRWLRPVLAGDTLSGEVEVVSARRSTSRPGIGILEVVTRIENQRGEQVAEMVNAVMFATRDAA